MGQQLAFSGASRKNSTQFLNAWAWEIGAQKADLGAVAASSLLTGSFGQVVSNKLWSPEQKKSLVSRGGASTAGILAALFCSELLRSWNSFNVALQKALQIKHRMCGPVWELWVAPSLSLGTALVVSVTLVVLATHESTVTDSGY